MLQAMQRRLHFLAGVFQRLDRRLEFFVPHDDALALSGPLKMVQNCPAVRQE
jgi:hypothetical protein